MEKYSYTIRPRTYPGGGEMIPPQLPYGYVYEKTPNDPNGNNCGNCFFHQNGYCDYWQAPVRSDYVCKAWRDTSSTQPNPLLTGRTTCVTGYTFPILLTQDFNDIGVYTPFDGLALQRDVLNNFVYTGNGQTICVFNSSDLHYKRFLEVSDYVVDWGDGSSNTTLNVTNTFNCHTYPPGDGIYSVSMTQNNPWGITKISKSITIPYSESPIRPNVFGTIELSPPGFGDPISCDTILQDYIFSGDSNPDTYDYFSSRYVNTPYPVTGFTNTSQLTTLEQYGTTPFPVSVSISQPNGVNGMINTITDSYTAYTIDLIDYVDYSGGTTYFTAYSEGLNEDNLEYVCCNEYAVLSAATPSCLPSTNNCSEDPQLDCWICHMGITCMTIQFYLDSGWGSYPAGSGTYANLLTYMVPTGTNPETYVTGNQGSPSFCSEGDCQAYCQ